MIMLTRRTLIATLIASSILPGAAMAEDNTITAQDALAKLESGELILVDVRRPDEWLSTGVAKGAWLLDMTDENFGAYLNAVLQRNPDHQIAIICRTGNRTGYLQSVLDENGMTGVLDVTEGMAGGPNGTGWIPSGLPIQDAREAYDAMPKDLIAK